MKNRPWRSVEWSADDFYAFMADPVMMHFAIFGKRMPPHQEMMMRGMWWRPVYMNTGGYRSGKSRIATYVQMQQAILISLWDEAVLSHTFRGAKWLFRDFVIMEYDSNPLFRAFCAGRPTRGASEWRLEFKNGSSITAYPADIMQGGMRLESLSVHGCTIDEITAISDPDVIINVMLNRVTKPPPVVARMLGITNTVRLIGAAKFSFQSIYQEQDGRGGLVQHVIRRMLEYAEHGDHTKSIDYLFETFNLEEHLPSDTQCSCGGVADDMGMQDDGYVYVKCRDCGYERVAWQEFFKGVLMRMRDAKSLMTVVLYAMRWLGKWQDVSEDLYSGRSVKNMRKLDSYVELARPEGDDKSIYGLGIDIGTGATAKHSVSAISVVKATPPDPIIRLVHAKKLRVGLPELSGNVYDLYERFSPSIIMVDPGGGGVWLVDSDHLAASKQVMGRGKVTRETTPLIMMDADAHQHGARIVQSFTPTMNIMEETLGNMKASDQLINWAHDLTSSAIRESRLVSPYRAVTSDGRGNDRIDEIHRDIEEALDGLLNIAIQKDENGVPLLTKNGFVSFFPKPDLAYSYVYGVCGLYLYLHDKRIVLDFDGEPMAALSSPIDRLGVASDKSEPLATPDDESMVFLSSARKFP